MSEELEPVDANEDFIFDIISQRLENQISRNRGESEEADNSLHGNMLGIYIILLALVSVLVGVLGNTFAKKLAAAIARVHNKFIKKAEGMPLPPATLDGAKKVIDGAQKGIKILSVMHRVEGDDKRGSGV